MEQYLTTYRKDYVWPYVRSLPTSSGPPHQKIDHGGVGTKPHECWCRQGPPAPSKEPKFYPVRVGAAPEVQSSREHQPDDYLTRLYEKYPYLYNVLNTAPPGDLQRRVRQARMRTTYRADYCRQGHLSKDQYYELQESLQAQAKPSETPGAQTPGARRETPGAQRETPGAPTSGARRRSGTLNAQPAPSAGEKTGRGSPGVGEGEGAAGAPMGHSEYMDGISRLGTLIMKDRIHHQKKESLES